MSLDDGKWIKKNEVREFKEVDFSKNKEEDDIYQIKLKFNEKIKEIDGLFRGFDFYFEKDNFYELFPVDSSEMLEFNSCLNDYKKFRYIDSSNIELMKSCIKLFDTLIPTIEKIENSMKTKFYPGIRREFEPMRQYSRDYHDYMLREIAKKKENMIDAPIGRKPK